MSTQVTCHLFTGHILLSILVMSLVTYLCSHWSFYWLHTFVHTGHFAGYIPLSTLVILLVTLCTLIMWPIICSNCPHWVHYPCAHLNVSEIPWFLRLLYIFHSFKAGRWGNFWLFCIRVLMAVAYCSSHLGKVRQVTWLWSKGFTEQDTGPRQHSDGEVSLSFIVLHIISNMLMQNSLKLSPLPGFK